MCHFLPAGGVGSSLWRSVNLLSNSLLSSKSIKPFYTLCCYEINVKKFIEDCEWDGSTVNVSVMPSVYSFNSTTTYIWRECGLPCV